MKWTFYFKLLNQQGKQCMLFLDFERASPPDVDTGEIWLSFTDKK